MKLIGLTGGVGMGKSTSAALLRERGIPLVDTDVLSREIVEPGEPALEEIRKTFGESVIDTRGRLRRDTLAFIVFSSESRRKQLEVIMHPRIRERWEEQVAVWRDQNEPVGVVVIPLLYEIQGEAAFDVVVCVACSAASQKERLGRRGWSPEECERRIAAQSPVEKKMAQAHYVVWTEGDLESHKAQWDQVLSSIRGGR
ncbi:MAG: dephospho-CoA kinase [Verrucomicrobia bacterium]|nr:dephospho-CoA kinase [Verrucomicrobiota bacterium]MBI3871382.1 dephospho-CoA kinase [Verrucomicrobiota bacterium]